MDTYEKVSRKLQEWEHHVDEAYSEEESITIDGLLAYHLNRLNGYGDFNDEKLYAEEQMSDILLMEALCGFEYFKKIKKIKERIKTRSK